MYIIRLLLIQFLLHFDCVHGVYSRQNQSNFLKDILEKCEPLVEPVDNISATIDVQIDLGIQAIGVLKEREQTLKTTIFLIIQWVDPDLTWTPNDNYRLSYELPNNMIWTPSLFIVNAVVEEVVIEKENGVSVLLHNGSLITTTFRGIETSCVVNTAKFPFDVQVCEIIIARAGGNINLIASPNINTELLKENNEWGLLSINFKYVLIRGERISRYEGVVVKIKLKRKALFHVLKSIVPSVLLSFINGFVFLLPPASGERMTMSISSFLSYAIYVTYIYESLPANSDSVAYFPVYLCWMMVQSGMIIIATLVSLKLYHQEQNDSQAPVLMSASSSKVAPSENPSCDPENVKTRGSVERKKFDKICFNVSLGLTCIATIWLFSLLFA
ncbi:hypothetical protein SNE40_008307 [Patella caerulea]|uniref:Neurotransmitter-gated ion-channel ligand-binding domain-containing protein n=1 Tax=Patella caerulea TaxID=87958 RepID=A0AAN8K1M0_PATCE